MVSCEVWGAQWLMGAIMGSRRQSPYSFGWHLVSSSVGSGSMVLMTFINVRYVTNISLRNKEVRLLSFSNTYFKTQEETGAYPSWLWLRGWAHPGDLDLVPVHLRVNTKRQTIIHAHTMATLEAPASLTFLSLECLRRHPNREKTLWGVGLPGWSTADNNESHNSTFWPADYQHWHHL